MTINSVAFVCVHNSCRSQIAEALAKKLFRGKIAVYSAGTEIKDRINQDAVRLMKEKYDIDMEVDQRSKLITDIPEVDLVVTMGCNVTCPVLPYTYQSEDWGLEDPTGQEDEKFIEVMETIENKLKDLEERIEAANK